MLRPQPRCLAIAGSMSSWQRPTGTRRQVTPKQMNVGPHLIHEPTLAPGPVGVACGRSASSHSNLKISPRERWVSFPEPDLREKGAKSRRRRVHRCFPGLGLPGREHLHHLVDVSRLDDLFRVPIFKDLQQIRELVSKVLIIDSDNLSLPAHLKLSRCLKSFFSPKNQKGYIAQW